MIDYLTIIYSSSKILLNFIHSSHCSKKMDLHLEQLIVKARSLACRPSWYLRCPLVEITLQTS